LAPWTFALLFSVSPWELAAARDPALIFS